MADILRFVLVDRANSVGDSEYTSREEAIRDAQKSDCAVEMRTYSCVDSELVWAPDDGDTWPPVD